MHLHKLTVEGFRSFGAMRAIYFDDLTAFIGANGTGKTATLAALAKLFSQRKSDRLIARSDFHIPNDKKAEDLSRQTLKIEATFHFDELGKEGIQPDSIAPFFSGMTITLPGESPVLCVGLEATWERSANPEGSIETNTYYVVDEDDGGEDVHAHVRRQALDAIRMIYVPANRDPQSELRMASGSLMGELLGSVKWDPERKDRTVKLIDLISKTILEQEGAKSISDSIKNTWKEYDYDRRYDSASISFVGSDFGEVVKRPTVLFSPTYGNRECEANDLSDGLRSLFHLSMVESLTSLEESIRERKGKLGAEFDIELPVLTILAIEEPENHIAPHLLGDLMGRISNLSSSGHCQAIVTSHSASIVSRVSPENIRHFRLEQKTGQTECRELKLPKSTDEVYKFVKGSLLSYPEVLFAKAVILGEGASEEIVLPRLIRARLRPEDELGVTVAPLGGRHVNHFWRLLNGLKIPYLTLLDFDNERYGGDDSRINYVVEQIKAIGGEFPSEFEGLGMSEKKAELERRGIFFSEPLDIDFCMLEAFPEEYKDTADGGPRTAGGKSIREIESKEPALMEGQDYKDRVESAIKVVLHSGDGHEDVRKNGHKGGDGHTYSEEQRELMPWYQYLFLGNRGKPTTHILALAGVDEPALWSRAPKTLKRLIDALHAQIGSSVDAQGVVENES